MPSTPTYIRAQQAARIIGFTRQALHDAFKAGKLPAVTVARGSRSYRLYDIEDVEFFAARRRQREAA